jgi:hypothetical protein
MAEDYVALYQALISQDLRGQGANPGLRTPAMEMQTAQIA